MIHNQKVLAIIPARGGSKGVAKKNIRIVGDKPLIAWTIEESKKSKYIDHLVLSSDDPEIIQVAQSYGCHIPFVRPKHLAQDTSSSIDVVFHAIDQIPGYDLIVLLQPTSPLKTVSDIDLCIEKCFKSKTKSCVSAREVNDNPHWVFSLNNENQMIPLLNPEKRPSRRQDLPNFYTFNGAVYVASTEFLRENRSFLSPETVIHIMDSETSIDLDTEFDFQVLDLLISKTNKTPKI